jgi:hypothetical protein
MLGVTRLEMNAPDRIMDARRVLSEIEKKLVAANAFGPKAIVSDIGDVGFRMRRSNSGLPHSGGDVSCLDELRILIRNTKLERITIEIVWKKYFNRSIMIVVLILIVIIASWPSGVGIISFFIASLAFFWNSYSADQEITAPGLEWLFRYRRAEVAAHEGVARCRFSAATNRGFWCALPWARRRRL